MPAHLIAYHYVSSGELLAAAVGGEPVRAAANDLLVFPRNDAHLLGSDLDLEPADADVLIQPGADGMGCLRLGGTGEKTRILCGFLGSDDRANPLIANLPPIMYLSLDSSAAGGWIEASMRYAVREFAAGRDDGATELSRLFELMFAEAVRGYIRSLPEESRGWLSGLRDVYVGRALSLIHGRLAHAWTLDELAREAGLSRSALAERFTRYIGMSPMRYLHVRRMQEAARQLQRTRATICQVASDVGYESEAAFSRAFKREFGMSPAAYRRKAE